MPSAPDRIECFNTRDMFLVVCHDDALIRLGDCCDHPVKGAPWATRGRAFRQETRPDEGRLLIKRQHSPTKE